MLLPCAVQEEESTRLAELVSAEDDSCLVTAPFDDQPEPAVSTGSRGHESEQCQLEATSPGLQSVVSRLTACLSLDHPLLRIVVARHLYASSPFSQLGSPMEAVTWLALPCPLLGDLETEMEGKDPHF